MLNVITKTMAKNSGVKILGGLIIGTAVGAIVGLLTAPDSGTKTRKKLDKKGKEISNDLSQTVNGVADQIKKLYQQYVTTTVESTKKELKSTANSKT